MLYHFCNDSFGLPFHRALTELAAREKLAATTVSERPLPAGRVERVAALFGTARRSKLVVANVNDDDFLARIRPEDTGIITGFRTIFKAAAIARFRRLINVHPSVLPLYRGPSPTLCCLQNGETRSGFTFHDVTPAVDAGPILYQEVVELDGLSSPLEAALHIARRALPAFERFARALASDEPLPESRVEAADVYRVHLGYCSGGPHATEAPQARTSAKP